MASTRHALILAAGEGKRLMPLTASVPKPMVPVLGTSMIDRAIERLKEHGVDRITVVAGHLESVLRQHLLGRPRSCELRVVYNPRFAETNSMFSLLLGLAHVDEPTWIVEADVVFEPAVLTGPLTHPLTWLVDRSARHLDGAFVLTEGSDAALGVEIVRDLRLIKPGSGKSVGILHADRDAVGSLREWLTIDLLDGRQMEYYDLVLSRRLPDPTVGVCDVAGRRWFEVDTADDLAQAERLFA